ncbi:MAG: thioredoxin domain-containing protein [candidate division WOR-3 bacterium]
MKKNWYKPAIAVVVVVLVAAVLILKLSRGAKTGNASSGIPAPAETLSAAPVTDSAVRTPQPVQTDSAPVAETVSPVPTGNVLAVVNNTRLTRNDLDKMFRSLPAQYQDIYKNDLEELLEQLIIRELLYQEAKKQGLVENAGATEPEQKKDRAIERLLQDRTSRLIVTEDEIRRFYEERQAEMAGASLNQVRDQIHSFLLQQKRGEAVDSYIESLKTRARIWRNEQWLSEQRAKKPADPLTSALKSGKPTVLDLGAGHCVPCRMMKPIFEELQREYGDRANIILLEISEYRALANKYNVRIIPTQIFFDKEGNVFWRHEGFLPKEEIIRKLKEMGME